MAKLEVQWDGKQYILPDGRTLTPQALKELGGREISRGGKPVQQAKAPQTEPQAPPTKMQEVQGVQQGLSASGYQMPLVPELEQQLTAGAKPWDIARARGNVAHGDYDLLLNNITPEEWMERQTQVVASDALDETAPKDRRLAGALLAYEDRAHSEGAGDWAAYGIKRLPYAGAVFSTAESVDLRHALERYREGEAETNDYYTIARFLRTSQFDQKKSLLRQAGDVASYLPAFAMEFLVGIPGIGGMQKAKQMGAATKFSFSGAGRGLVQGAGKRGLARASGAVTRAGVQAALMPQRIMETAERYRTTDEDSIGKAYAKGFVDTAIEAFSEASGETFMKGASKLARQTRITNAMRKWMSSKLGRSLTGPLQDPFSEILEERVGEELRKLSVEPNSEPMSRKLIQGKYQEAAEQLFVEAAAFAGVPIVGSMGTAVAKESAPPEAEPPKREPGTGFVMSHETPEQEAGRAASFDKMLDEMFNEQDAEWEPAKEPQKQLPGPAQDQLQLPPPAEDKFFEGDRDLIESVADLPDNPTRSEFADAIGVDRKRAHQNEQQRISLVQRARELRLQLPKAWEPGKPFVDLLNLPEEQKAKILSHPEAETRIREELGGWSKWDIAKRFNWPTKRSKVRSKDSMINQVIEDYVKPYQETPYVEEQAAPATVEATPVPENDAVTPAPPESTAEGVTPSVPVGPGEGAPAAQGGAETSSEESGALPPLTPGEQAIYDQLPADQQALVEHAKGFKIPTRGKTAEQLRRAIAARLAGTDGTGPRRTVISPTPYAIPKEQLDEATAMSVRLMGKRTGKYREAHTDMERDIAAYAHAIGAKVVFADEYHQEVGATTFETSHGNLIVVAMDRANPTEAHFFRVIGHELAHATGHDKLEDLFGKEALLEAAVGYARRAQAAGQHELARKLVDSRGQLTELGRREAAAEIFGRFTSDPAFRAEVLRDNPGLWKKIIDTILAALEKVGVRSNEMKRALEVLRSEREAVQKRTENRRPGRPSNQSKGMINAAVTATQAVNDWLATTGEEMSAEERKALADQIVEVAGQEHKEKYKIALAMNDARRHLRNLTNQTANKMARLHNSGKDFSNQKVQWDVWGEETYSHYPKAFQNHPDWDGENYAAVAAALVAEGDTEIPTLDEDAQAMEAAIQHVLFPRAATSKERDLTAELSILSADWDEADWDGHWKTMEDAKAHIEEQSGFPVSPDDPLILRTVLDFYKTQGEDPGFFQSPESFLTEEERREMRSDTMSRLVGIFKEYGRHTKDMVAAARAGDAKKGWYERAHDAVFTLFPPDEAPRFVSVLAATSPSTDPVQNLIYGLEVWKAWKQAGEPSDPAKIRKLLRKMFHADWNAYENNLVTALSTDDPMSISLSGYKVRSFRKNLLGDLSSVTMDRWMAEAYGASERQIFDSRSLYYGLAAVTRKVAREAGIEPAQAQETIWSFVKAVGAAKAIGIPKSELVRTLSTQSIGIVPEFAETLVHDQRIRNLVRAIHGQKGVAALRRIAGQLPDRADKSALPGSEDPATAKSLGKVAGRIRAGKGGRRIIGGFTETLLQSPEKAPEPFDYHALKSLEAKALAEKMRHKGRTNASTTAMGRMMVWGQSRLLSEPQVRPHYAEDVEAAQRLKKDAEGELQRIIENVKAGRNTPPTIDMRKLAVESAIHDQLLNDLSVKAAMGDRDAFEKSWYVNQSRILYRREISRALSRRDPLMFGNKRDTLRYHVMRALLNTKDQAESQKILDELEKLGITLENLEMQLANEMAALKVVRIITDAKSKFNIWDMSFEWYSNAILSGPLTHVKNSVSNTTWFFYMFGVERGLEAGINACTGNLNGAQLGEFKYAWAGFKRGLGAGLKNLVKTWNWEASALEEELGMLDIAQQKFDTNNNRAAIPGTFGRIVRIPWRGLSALDDFAKTVIVYSQVNAIAYRKAKMAGLQGKAMEDFIARELSDVRNTSWSEAFVDALEGTFQQEGNKVTRGVKKGGSFLRKTWLGKMLIPFMQFPVNAVETALARVPIVGIIEPVYERFFTEEKTPKRWDRIASRQLAGSIATAVLYAMVFGGDDEDDQPIITGSAAVNYRVRGHQYRVATPHSVRLFGQYRDYGFLEPFALTTTTIVDGAAAWKKKGAGAVVDETLKSAARQASDKTYMLMLGDIMKTWESWQEGGEGRDLRNIPSTVAAGFLPNIAKQPTSLWRNTVLEQTIRKSDTQADALRKTARKMQVFPWVNDVYKRDIWGRIIQPNSPKTTAIARLTNPSRAGLSVEERIPADIALARWNEEQERKGEKTWLPDYPDRKLDGQVLSEKDHDRYCELAGKGALRRCESIEFTDPPTKAQIERIKTAFEQARSEARSEIRRLREQPATSD